LSDARTTIPVAVVLPSFRRKEFLARALASVALQQVVKPAEVIVVDDGSFDGTADLARSLGAHVIEKPLNEGLAAARDDAARAAEGSEWLAMLDDDDQWLPDHLETVWSNRDGHVMVGGASVSFGDGEPRLHGTPLRHPELVTSPRRLVFPENSFTTSAVLVRRDVLLDAGGFDRKLHYMEDIDAWLRVLERGTGLMLPDITCLYRHHGGQISRDRQAMLDAGAMVFEKYKGRDWLTPLALEGLAVTDHWDEFQSARRQRDWPGARSAATFIASRPSRLWALARLLAFRKRVRRRAVHASVARVVEEHAGAGRGVTQHGEHEP